MQVEKNCVLPNLKKDCHVYDWQDNDELCPSVKKDINEIIKKEGYITYKVSVRSLKADGGNYLAKLFTVDIIGTTAEGPKETNIFLKQALSQYASDSFISMDDAYFREIFYYKELCLIYEKLQIDAGIKPSEMIKSAKCYNVSCTEAIFLENLTKHGFNVIHRMDVFPLKFAELSFQNIAKFHALSFVVQKRMPEYYNKKKESCKSIIDCENENFENFTIKLIEFTSERCDEDIKNKLRKNISVVVSRYKSFLTDKMSSVHCLCHGDFRLNNVLAKKMNGNITEVMPIDYQLYFYGSPITDLIYFLYMGSDKNFRNQHENHLKNLYYATLENFLRNFDIDVESVFPRKVFENDYERIREYGLYVAVLYLPFVFTKENDVPDFENTEILEADLKVEEKFYERISEIFDELVHYIES